jgi:catechol 2,3-dioxygenase-like lactoylglutathione lyase family enzyme
MRVRLIRLGTMAQAEAAAGRARPQKDWRAPMTLLDHVVLQVDDLNAIGAWYDQVVRVAGGARTFDTPNLIGYALPGQPAQLFFSLATDHGGRQTHLALRVEDETTVRLVHELATALGAEILHEPRLWPEYAPDYFAVFIRDPAGNNLELKCQASTARPTLSAEPITPAKPSQPN